MASRTHLGEFHRLPDESRAWAARAPSQNARGPALMLLHGACVDHRVWDKQLTELGRAGVRVFAPDLPGHGRSSGPLLREIASLASWTLQLVGVLALERLVLAGHSMGALIAVEAASRLGDRVRGLVLLGAALEMPVNPALLSAAETDPARAAAMIAAWGLGPAAQSDDRADELRDMIAGSPSGVLAADLTACASYRDGTIAAQRIACPVLVAAGALDRMTPAKHGRALAQVLEHVEFVEWPGIGHMLPVEAPEAVTEALIRIAHAKGAGR